MPDVCIEFLRKVWENTHGVDFGWWKEILAPYRGGVLSVNRLFWKIQRTNNDGLSQVLQYMLLYKAYIPKALHQYIAEVDQEKITGALTLVIS
jgi:hypothetical protein